MIICDFSPPCFITLFILFSLLPGTAFHFMCVRAFTFSILFFHRHKLLVYEKFLVKFRYFKIELYSWWFLRHKLQVFFLNQCWCDTVGIIFPSSFPSMGSSKPVHIFVTSVFHFQDSGHSKETSQNSSTHTVKAQSSGDSISEATQSPSNNKTSAEAVNSLKMHITVLNLFTWIVLLNLPSLIYWLKNLR